MGISGRKSLTVLLAIIVLVISSLRVGFAATQGTLGATSTGTSVVTLTIPALFRISGIGDLALGTYSGTGTMTANDDICVYSNSSGNYRVRITDNSEMTANQFAVENAANTGQIAMEVRWNDVIGITGNVAVTYNTPLASQTGANTQTTDCSVGGLKANLQVNFTQANLLAAPASAYSSTLTITIEP